LLTSKIADAVIEGVQQRESELAKAEAEAEIGEEGLEEELEPGEEVKPEVEVTLEEMAAAHVPAAEEAEPQETETAGIESAETGTAGEEKEGE
jgi:hypothetical protein